MSASYPTPTFQTETILAGGSVAGTFSGNPTWSGNHTFQGTSALNGATTVGTSSAATSLIRNGPNNSTRIDEWQTAASKRWRWQVDGNETGANAGATLRLFGFDDTGTSLGEVMRFTRSNGNVTWNNNGTYVTPTYLFKGSIQNNTSWIQSGTWTMTSGVAPGPGGLSPMMFYNNTIVTGTLDTGGNPHFSFWNVTDTVNANRALTNSQMLNMTHSYNAGANSDRSQLGLVFAKNAASLDGLTTNVFNMLVFMHADVMESTTPGTYLSRAGVVNFDGRIGGTGYYVNALTVNEQDIRVFSGNHVLTKINLALNCGVSDAVHALDDDAALKFTSSPTILAGTGGMLNLIQVGGANSTWPLDATVSTTTFFHIQQPNPNGRYGTLQDAWTPKVGVGFDCWGAKATTAMFRTVGLTIDGSGQLPVLGPGAITYSSSGIKIAVPNVIEVSATVAAGGSGYRVNDYITDAIGGLWKVSTITGGPLGPVTAVTLDTAAYSSPAPTNPVATTGGTGTGLTLNITTSATGGLVLSDTGQKLGFYGTAAGSKPTVTGSKGANAALTSLLSALSTLGLLTDSST